MEKNENKFISKAKEVLVLVLFTVIYFFFQKTIYPVLGLLFWFSFMLIFGGIVDALGILKVKGSEVIFTYIFYFKFFYII